MNIKYFILTSTLISTISYSMESSQTKKETCPTDSIPTALVPKNYLTPKAIHITGFDTLIPFNGTNKPLFHRLNNRHKNKFGNTFVASLAINRTYGNQYEENGYARTLNQYDMTKIAEGSALYISNMKQTDIKQKDGTPLIYGAILLSNSQYCFSNADDKALKAKRISEASNVFQGYYLANQSKK